MIETPKHRLSTHINTTNGVSENTDTLLGPLLSSHDYTQEDDAINPIKIRKNTLYLSVYIGLCEGIYADIQNEMHAAVRYINNKGIKPFIPNAFIHYNDFRTVTNIIMRHKINNLFTMTQTNAMFRDVSQTESERHPIATSIVYKCVEELNTQSSSGPLELNAILNILKSKNDYRENFLHVQITKGFLGIMLGLFLHGTANRKKLIKSVLYMCDRYNITHVFAGLNMLTIALMTAYLIENKPVETWLDRCCDCIHALADRLDTQFKKRHAVQQDGDGRASNNDLVDVPSVGSFIRIIKKFQETNFKNKKYNRDPKEFDEFWREYSNYHYTSPAIPAEEDNHCLAIIAYDLLLYAQGHQSRYFYISSSGIPSCIGMVVGFWNGMLHPGCTHDTVESIPTLVPRQEELLRFARQVPLLWQNDRGRNP